MINYALYLADRNVQYYHLLSFQVIVLHFLPVGRSYVSLLFELSIYHSSSTAGRQRSIEVVQVYKCSAEPATVNVSAAMIWRS